MKFGFLSAWQLQLEQIPVNRRQKMRVIPPSISNIVVVREFFFVGCEQLSLGEQVHYGLASPTYEGGPSATFGMKALLDVHSHGGGDGGVEIFGFELRIRFSAFFICSSYGFPTFYSSAPQSA